MDSYNCTYNSIINENLILLDIDARDKDELFHQMADKLKEENIVGNTELFCEALYKREQDGPTGIGDGFAIPHGISETVSRPGIVFARLKKRVKYESLDNLDIKYVFMLAISPEKSSLHIQILSSVACLLLDDSFKNTLKTCNSKETIISSITNELSKKNIEEANTMTDNKKVVAISACPTGIAHTYMAEKSLLEAAKELNVHIRIEKQGAAGQEDALTAKEIREADVVILAIGKNIDESRFNGKDILKVNPDEAIKDGCKVINKALNKEGTYIGSGSSSTGNEDTSVFTTGTGIIAHLMVGIGEMVPIVVVGGILTALSFAFGINAGDVEGTLPWALKQIGSAALGIMMFSVLSGYIASSIGGKIALAAGLIGGYLATVTVPAGFIGAVIAGIISGYLVKFLNNVIKVPQSIRGMKNLVIIPVLSCLIVGLIIIFVIGKPITLVSDYMNVWLQQLSASGAGILTLSVVSSLLYVDMGGTLSHVLYAFSLAAIGAGNYVPIAANMTMGMVPPLGLALATLLMPKLFSEMERETGKTALVLGASFITEGAIPFALAHLKIALLANFAGCLVGSILTYTFQIEVHAPHGGLWLLLIPNSCNNIFLWLVSIGGGTIVTALVLIVLMKFSSKSGKKQTA